MTGGNTHFLKIEDVLIGLGTALDATIVDLGSIENSIVSSLEMSNDFEGFQSFDFCVQRLENVLLVLTYLSESTPEQFHVSKSDIEKLVNLEFISGCLGLSPPQRSKSEVHSKTQRDELF